MNTFELDSKYVAGTYRRFPVEIVSGKGAHVLDCNGKEYIDMGSGIATTTFGHADEEWIAAVTAQMNCFSHTSNLYYTSPCARLAEMLCQRTGMCRVFFGNSGAEANEGAIKAARKYSFDKYGEGRHKIVTLENSFHGRTITTLAATGQEVFHTTFMPFTEGFRHVPANDTGAMLEAMTDDVCAVMIELVQGEGGVNPLHKDYVRTIATACSERDILLVVDEVQTGNGRTGTLYAFEQFAITPDIVTTAKGLGGGLPIGAVILGEKVKDTLSPGSHGSTFGGNPVCAAGALNVISRLDEAFLADVRKKSEYIIEKLNNIHGVLSVSGLGLMLGVKAEKPTAEIISRSIEKGVLFLSAKDKLRLLPPLNITYAEIDRALAVLAEILSE